VSKFLCYSGIYTVAATFVGRRYLQPRVELVMNTSPPQTAGKAAIQRGRQPDQKQKRDNKSLPSQ